MELMTEIQLEKRLDDFRSDVDHRFEAVDERFTAIDQRFDRVEAEIRLLREEMMAGFRENRAELTALSIQL